jgi:disulfide bond formation protein DsbB
VSPPLARRLADVGLLAIVLALAAVLTAALVLEFAFGEKPCPLCLIERIGMFGICAGLGLHLRGSLAGRGVGLGLLCAVGLLVVSVRQVLLDICPRPGHAYVGSAVLGLHMPVWAVLIALAVIAGIAVLLAGFGADALRGEAPAPAVARCARWATLYVAALSAVNLAAVAL